MKKLIIVILPLFLFLSLVVINKNDQAKKNINYITETNLSDGRKITSLTFTSLKSVKKELENNIKEMKDKSYSAIAQGDSGVRYQVDYDKNITHIQLYNSKDIFNEEILGRKNTRYDFYMKDSDGNHLRNRVVACVNKYECKDLTLSLLGIPPVYFEIPPINEVDGIESITIAGILGISNSDVGFWRLFSKLNFTINESDVMGVKIKLSDGKKCIGYIDKKISKNPNLSDINGWCFKNGIYYESIGKNTNLNKIISIKKFEKFYLPSNVTLDPNSNILSEDVVSAISNSKDVSKEFIYELKNQPFSK